MSEAQAPVDQAQVLADAVAANPRVQRRIREDAERYDEPRVYVSGEELLRLLDGV